MATAEAGILKVSKDEVDQARKDAWIKLEAAILDMKRGGDSISINDAAVDDEIAAKLVWNESRITEVVLEVLWFHR